MPDSRREIMELHVILDEMASNIREQVGHNDISSSYNIRNKSEMYGYENVSNSYSGHDYPSSTSVDRINGNLYNILIQYLHC
jgi:hypothetical protein